MTQNDETSRPNVFGRVVDWMGGLSALILGFLMVFIVIGATLRYLFNAPIPGGNEIVELTSVAIVMLAIPLCTLRDAHVRIDLLDNLLRQRGRVLTDMLYYAIGFVVLGFLVKAYIKRTVEALEFEDRTNMIGVVIWPFYALVVLGMALFGLILIMKLLRLAQHRGRDHE